MKKVLEKAGIDASATRWSTGGGYPQRPYCAQLRESDWAFIERLLAEEGIYYEFELGDDATVLVFSDDSSAAPEIEDGATVPYHDDDQLHAVRDSVTHVGKTTRLTTDAVRLRDYNAEKPRLKLDAQVRQRQIRGLPIARPIPGPEGRWRSPRQDGHPGASGDARSGLRRHDEHPPSPRTLLRAHRSPRRVAQRPLPPRVRRATEAWSTAAARGTSQGLTMRWTATPESPSPYRATQSARHRGDRRARDRRGRGRHRARKVHPDASFGRVRVRLHKDREGKRDDKTSTWMRVGQFALGGSMILPRAPAEGAARRAPRGGRRSTRRAEPPL